MRPRSAFPTPFRFVALAASVVAAGAAGAATTELPVASLAATARAVPVGSEVRITGLSDAAAARSVALVARRFEVFTPDARVVHVDARGEHLVPTPRIVYFRGRIEGAEGARAVLAVHETGLVRGLSIDPSGAYLILPGAGSAAATELRRIDPSRTRSRPFACASAALGTDAPGRSRNPIEALLELAEAPLAPPPAHTARLAIETDFEFFQLFGNDVDARNYVADVVAFLALVYEDEVDTSLAVSYLRTWGTAADPWNQGSTLCNLLDFGKHWNDLQAGVPRTIAHMMSGRNNGGGVAWLGVLCAAPFNYNATGLGCTFTGVANYGGGYGYTGEMDGTFLYESPGVLWDVVATAHEIGHNFSSAHTHCYAGVGANPSQVDRCYVAESNGGGDTCNAGTQNWNGSGCACNPGGFPATLPGVGALAGGTPGGGNGTIMSYCHLLGGGFGNVTYTFGEGHPFGVAAGRVPAQMMTHVATVAAGNPSCLAFVPGTSVIFRHGVDQGSTAGWTIVVP